MRTLILAALGALIAGGALAATGTPNTVTTTPDPAGGAGCLTVTVYDQQGNPHVSTWCPAKS